jgi:hypothetical protein
MDKKFDSRLLRNRDCHAVVSWMLHNWSVKCVLLLDADPGPGSIESGQKVDGSKESGLAIDESAVPDLWDGNLPQIQGGSAPRVTATIEESARAFELTRVRLMKLSEARRVADVSARGALTRFELDLRRSKMTTRKVIILKGCKRIMAEELAIAHEHLFAALLKRRRRIGTQCVVTRRSPSKLPLRKLFEFSGRPAWRQGRGRPALPRSVWLERYERRLTLRRKTARRGKRGVVKVPRTKFKRPNSVLNLDCSKLRPGFTS